MMPLAEQSPMPNVTPPIERWPLRGGEACLDFANSVAWRPNAHPLDALGRYDDLVAWALHAGVLTAEEAERLRARAADDEPGAGRALADAIALREATYRLFIALARGGEFAAADLATINAALVDGVARSEVVPEGGGFVKRGAEGEDALALPAWKLAESASNLLVSGDWMRVRECPGHDCGWLFLDRTKNGNRRWCDSADCGNRARVRAHYRRSRETSGKDQPRG
jgi:predicted RNA-binding Zn ribbon-like protein